MATWGELQSICQLSVGLNATLNAVLLFNSGFDRLVLARLHRWESIVQAHFRTGQTTQRARLNQVTEKIMNIRQDVMSSMEKFSINLWFRTACLIGMLIAFVGLYWSSFFSKDPILEWLRILMLLSVTPVIVASVFIYAMSLFLSVRYKHQLRDIEQDIRALGSPGTS